MHRALQTAQYKHLGPTFRICLEFTLSFNPDYMNLNAMILKTWTFLISPLLSSIAIQPFHEIKQWPKNTFFLSHIDISPNVEID